MKKLQNLTEPQKLTALVSPLPLVALVASVALLAHYIDLMSALFIVVALLLIGAISSGVVVAVVKDYELARVVRGMRYTTNAITAERDELSDKLENALADLRDERDRVRVLSAQVMSDAEELESVTNGYRALNTENADNARHIGALRDRVRTLTAELAWARELLARDGRDLVEHEEADAYAETAFTHSASTAFAIGTLDKAYVVNGETRYPLA